MDIPIYAPDYNQMNTPITAPGYNQMNIPIYAPGYYQMNNPVADSPFYSQMNIPVATPLYNEMNIDPDPEYIYFRFSGKSPATPATPLYNEINIPVPADAYFRGKSVPVYNVCSNKKCFADHLNEAKMRLNNHPEIQLSAVEMAIPDAIRIAEILEKTRFAAKKEVLTYTVPSTNRGRGLDKVKIKIRLRRMRDNKDKY